MIFVGIGGVVGFVLVYALGSYAGWPPYTMRLCTIISTVIGIIVGWCIYDNNGGSIIDDVSRYRKRKKREREMEKQEEIRRREEETNRQEQERINELIARTRERIKENQGYELDLIPFLDYLSHAEENDIEFNKLITTLGEKAVLRKKLAGDLNQVSKQYNIGIMLEVHTR